MSISDFVNRQVSSNTSLNKAGAIQTAIDQSLNFITRDDNDEIIAEGPLHKVKREAGGELPQDPADTYWQGVPISYWERTLEPDDGNPTLPLRDCR